MEPNGEWGVHLEMLESLRYIIRRHQQKLIESPDPSNEWWFLVDPNAANVPTGEPWRSN